MANKESDTESTHAKQYVNGEETHVKQYFANDKIYRIILLGPQGAGKRSFINRLASGLPIPIQLCKPSVSSVHALIHCQQFEIQLFGYKLRVVNTPGFSNPNISEDDLYRELQNGLKLATGEPSAGVDVFILIVRPEFFGKDHKMMFNTIEKIFGECIYKHMQFVFSCQDLLEAEDNNLLKFLLNSKNDMLKKILQKVDYRHISVNNKSRDVHQAELIVKEIVSFVKHKNETFVPHLVS